MPYEVIVTHPDSKEPVVTVAVPELLGRSDAEDIILPHAFKLAELTLVAAGVEFLDTGLSAKVEEIRVTPAPIVEDPVGLGLKPRVVFEDGRS